MNDQEFKLLLFDNDYFINYKELTNKYSLKTVNYKLLTIICQLLTINH